VSVWRPPEARGQDVRRQRQGFPEAREWSEQQHMGPARDCECRTSALDWQTRLKDFPPRLLGTEHQRFTGSVVCRSHYEEGKSTVNSGKNLPFPVGNKWSLPSAFGFLKNSLIALLCLCDLLHESIAVEQVRHSSVSYLTRGAIQVRAFASCLACSRAAIGNVR
ncbi:hypothetical protein MC885_001287, partial [Smutsia gigantea]